MSLVVESSQPTLDLNVIRARQSEPAKPSDPGPHFSREEIQGFRADDAVAGATIARIMTALFTYTVIIMTVVILWTYTVVS